jgi:NDP-sugar pyrophosphorylase family protein
MIIGPHSTVEGHATIVGPTAIGAGCTVCSEALVCRSVLWDAARVQGGCSVDRCILTYNADLNEQMTRGEVVCPEVRT